MYVPKLSSRSYHMYFLINLCVRYVRTQADSRQPAVVLTVNNKSTSLRLRGIRVVISTHRHTRRAQVWWVKHFEQNFQNSRVQHCRNTKWTSRAAADIVDRMRRGSNKKVPDDRLGTVDRAIREKKIFTALVKMPDGVQEVLLENGWIGKTPADNSESLPPPTVGRTTMHIPCMRKHSVINVQNTTIFGVGNWKCRRNRSKRLFDFCPPYMKIPVPGSALGGGHNGAYSSIEPRA